MDILCSDSSGDESDDSRPRRISGPKLVRILYIQHNQLLQADGIIKQLKRQKAVLQSTCSRIVNGFKGIVEAELQCSICTEIFINPVNLSCTHTVCNHCWVHWKNTNSTMSCPICRVTVTSNTKALVTENFINKFVDGLGGEYKKKRQQIISERLSEPAPKKMKFEPPEPSFHYNPPPPPNNYLDTDSPIILLRDAGRPSNSRLPPPQPFAPRVPVITIEESVILVE